MSKRWYLALSLVFVFSLALSYSLSVTTVQASDHGCTCCILWECESGPVGYEIGEFFLDTALGYNVCRHRSCVCEQSCEPD